MTDKERGQNIQFLILPSTIAVVDKGTSLHCYYVKMCRTGKYAYSPVLLTRTIATHAS